MTTSKMRAGSPRSLDFPFYVIDLRADFAARVMGQFRLRVPWGPHAQSVRDVQSRNEVRPLWSRARALGADYVATGDYARIESGADGRFHLYRAADEAKDQSYFLFTLRQHELARTRFSRSAT